jgi:hypothetical protein
VRTRLQSRSSWRLVLLVAGVVVYAWIAAALRPFTEPENLVVAAPIVAVGVMTARPIRSDPMATAARASAGWRRAALLWLAVVLVLATWELLALFSSPRDEHPTLSYLADRIMSTHVGRTVVFLVWLGLGAALAVRPWRPVRR